MKNTNKFSKSVLALSILAVSTMASAVTAPGGTIHFKGQIVNAACAVSADSDGQTVNLGQYRTALFKDIGDKSNPVNFNIKLEDCEIIPGQENVSVAFSGNAPSEDATLLQISNIQGGTSGAASGVGIEIADHTGKILSPNGADFSETKPVQEGSNILTFSARYKSIVKDVTAGRADADATFTMQYN